MYNSYVVNLTIKKKITPNMQQITSKMKVERHQHLIKRNSHKYKTISLISYLPKEIKAPKMCVGMVGCSQNCPYTRLKTAHFKSSFKSLI